jgi:hypothetical protein
LNWWGYYNVGSISTSVFLSLDGSAAGIVSYNWSESDSMDAPMEEPATVMNGAFKDDSDKSVGFLANKKLETRRNRAQNGADISGGDGGKVLESN